MEKTRREFIKMTGGAALGSGLVLGGLGKSAQAVPPSKPLKGVPSTPLKIGVMPPLSGIPAYVGEAGWRATQLWADDCNAAGGILGRKIELHLEEETTPKEAVEKFRKLTMQIKCDVIVGVVFTSTSLALAPVAEELGQLFLSWDGTTQKGLEETMPNPKYIFKSSNNEAEAVQAAIMAAELFPNTKRIAGINLDYSYGRCVWESFRTVLKYFLPKVEVAVELWPKFDCLDFTPYIPAIRKEKPDLLMASFAGQTLLVFLKQAIQTGLFKEMKGCMIEGGQMHEELKKEFTPEGMILGYNSLYFKWTDTWPLLRDSVNKYYARFKSYPISECDNAYFVLESYKTAVEKAYSITGTWPTKEQIAKILPNIEVECPSGYRSWSHDKRMLANYFMGVTTHKNPYDFVTIDQVRVMSPAQIQIPYGMKFEDWVKGWGKV
ncbi:MAG: ABC transporter substrate-binding protein [Thermodesulfobacteriota bacterium]